MICELQKMAGNTPRKFKDRIAMLNQKEAESTAQFKAVMEDVGKVKRYDGPGTVPHMVPSEAAAAMMMPRHLAPGLPNHHPHFR